MGSLLSKHQADPKDYDRVLLQLDKSIRQSEDNVAEIKRQQHTVSRRVYFYGFLLCCMVALYSFIKFTGTSTFDLYAYAACLGLGTMLLVGIFYARRIVHCYYRRKLTREETRLTALRTKQALQLEKLKKKTACDATLSLLERYDPAAAYQIKTAQQQQQQQHNDGHDGDDDATKWSSGKLLPTEVAQRKFHHLRQRIDAEPVHYQGHTSPAILLPQQPSPIPSQEPSSPPQPGEPRLIQWYSKLIDVLVGEDGTSEKKYALVCHHCFAHNGLVLKDEIDHIQYTCPYCKQFNPTREEKIKSIEETSSLSSSDDADSTMNSTSDESFAGEDEL